MKILHISAQKPDSTGSGIYLSGLIKSMIEKDSQGLIVGIDREDNIDKIKEKFKNNISIYPLIYNSEELEFDVPGMSDNMPYKSTRYRDIDEDKADKIKKEYTKILKKAVKEFEPDIILCHHLYYITSITRETFPNLYIAAICHGTCLRQLYTNDFKKEYIIDNISKLDRILSLHERQKKEISQQFKLKKEVSVIGSGYDNKIFYPDKKLKKTNKKIRISYAGKLSYSKGLLEFFRAIKKLQYNSDEIEFIIMGDASIESEKNAILNEAKEIKYKVDFRGRVEQKLLSEELRKSDIFVLPSYYEGLPLVVLEAMACGNYIITSNTDGLSDWLGDDINNSDLIEYVRLPKMKGVGIPEDDEKEDYEERIKNAIIKAVEYRKKNPNTYIDASSLSWDAVRENIYDIVQKDLKDNGEI